MALYFADWDRGGRELMVELFDGQTKNLIVPLQALHDYRGGVYLVYRYDRSARFRIRSYPREECEPFWYFLW